MASRSGVLGWVTGVVSTVLGALAFGAVLCLWFPAVLTTPALRDVYPMDVVRTTIKVALGVAFVLGVVSGLLERRKALGLTGAGLALLATLMGGSEVAVATPVARSSHVGLDWFLLDLFLLAAIFVPIELLWARLDQPVFRDEWRTDLWHFGVSHLLVQLTVFLTMAPWPGSPTRSSSWRCWWWRTSPSTPCTGSSTRCRGSGASTRSTIRAAPWTGSPARACTWSTSW